MRNRRNTWFITGCSTGGLGEGIALAALQQGDNVIATARSLDKLQPLLSAYPESCVGVILDVTSSESIDNALYEAKKRFGQIDYLVNNAGYAYRCAVEEGDSEGIAQLYKTNLMGPIELIQKVLPDMRQKQSGAIINISSVSAYFSQAGSAYYASTKAALELLSDGLAKEVATFGVKVMLVELSAFKTNFHSTSLRESSTKIDAYASTWATRPGHFDPAKKIVTGDPLKGGKIIVDIIEKDDYPFRLVLGSSAVSSIEKTLKDRLDELEKWKSVSVLSDI